MSKIRSPIISPPPDGVDLDRLFRRWHERESARDWEKAGFDVLRDKEDKILVLYHPSAKGYLFKKYGSDDYQSPREQLELYGARVAGAALLRAHITDNDLRRVVVPRKWLCELPAASRSRGGSPHVVVVDRHKILDAEESGSRYRHIDAKAARELCTILFAFQGLDFKARNAPFTRDGRISFIDTEFVRHSRKKPRSRKRYYQKYVDSMLSRHERLADEVWHELVSAWRAASG